MLAGLGLGNFTINVVCFSLCIGVTGATDTLCSQAFGSEDYKRVGHILRRSQVVVSLMFIPMIFILLNAEWILTMMG